MEFDRDNLSRYKRDYWKNMDGHLKSVVKYIYPYDNFTTCTIFYKYSNFNTTKKTLVQYPQENTSGGTTSGNVSKYTNNTWNQLLTNNL